MLSILRMLTIFGILLVGCGIDFNQMTPILLKWQRYPFWSNSIGNIYYLW